MIIRHTRAWLASISTNRVCACTPAQLEDERGDNSLLAALLCAKQVDLEHTDPCLYASAVSRASNRLVRIESPRPVRPAFVGMPPSGEYAVAHPEWGLNGG